VRETLAAINVIVDRTNCIYGVREALGRADYEAAAAFIGKFLEIQEQHGPLGPSDGAQAAEQAQVRIFPVPYTLPTVLHDALPRATLPFFTPP